MIKFNNVQLGYGRKPVLTALNFDIQRGDFFGIVGPNGAGKTTLLKAILGLLKPLKGKIKFIFHNRVAVLPLKYHISISFTLIITYYFCTI